MIEKPNPLSFDELAKGIARTMVLQGEGPAEDACARLERNVGWDRKKLFARAVELRDVP
jgi:hypothetical protein